MAGIAGIGAGGKASGWLKLGAVAATIGMAWLLAWELGLFLVLMLSGGLVVVRCIREKGNIVDLASDFVFFTALMATAMAAPIQTTADGMKATGPVLVQTVTKRWNERDPAGFIAPTAPTTTAVPPPPGQAAAAPILAGGPK